MRQTAAASHRAASPGSRRIHRLMDEVYREMYLLESGRPGAEMGLALALLRARVASDLPPERREDWEWLRTVCPLCLKMIEESLARGGAAASVPGSAAATSCASCPSSGD